MDTAECSSRAREYRDLAIECSLRAEGAITPQARACYESVAQSYRHMAEDLEALDRQQARDKGPRREQSAEGLQSNIGS